ncbi:uncharacterized protein LACBIDRAFT_322477 [Laccaria bicolor S238N-H82]|uniref:Predicted protein n=1 Tax=Laccaria bicolor (strain S238N-H82 / ATCC MYA-4686) TaxID=486041 RepID=B0CWF5_LACBS|nr:uncharacterized protein LACBIDRAFT_322477 [Laccaria bicolor S238N-H82]EDR13501.1 predicted protein [Laccaria bicolor S238N-H82]|eukprot:XP_001875999.1 predicted protein [Laccaria bicolor S238N-H82]
MCFRPFLSIPVDSSGFLCHSCRNQWGMMKYCSTSRKLPSLLIMTAANTNDAPTSKKVFLKPVSEWAAAARAVAIANNSKLGSSESVGGATTSTAPRKLSSPPRMTAANTNDAPTSKKVVLRPLSDGFAVHHRSISTKPKPCPIKKPTAVIWDSGDLFLVKPSASIGVPVAIRRLLPSVWLSTTGWGYQPWSQDHPAGTAASGSDFPPFPPPHPRLPYPPPHGYYPPGAVAALRSQLMRRLVPHGWYCYITVFICYSLVFSLSLPSPSCPPSFSYPPSLSLPISMYPHSLSLPISMYPHSLSLPISMYPISMYPLPFPSPLSCLSLPISLSLPPSPFHVPAPFLFPASFPVPPHFLIPPSLSLPCPSPFPCPYPLVHPLFLVPFDMHCVNSKL